MKKTISQLKFIRHSFVCAIFSIILLIMQSCGGNGNDVNEPAKDSAMMMDSMKMTPMQDTVKAVILDTGKDVNGGKDKPTKP